MIFNPAPVLLCDLPSPRVMPLDTAFLKSYSDSCSGCFLSAPPPPPFSRYSGMVFAPVPALRLLDQLDICGSSPSSPAPPPVLALPPRLVVDIFFFFSEATFISGGLRLPMFFFFLAASFGRPGFLSQNLLVSFIARRCSSPPPTAPPSPHRQPPRHFFVMTLEMTVGEIYNSPLLSLFSFSLPLVMMITVSLVVCVRFLDSLTYVYTDFAKDPRTC